MEIRTVRLGNNALFIVPDNVKLSGALGVRWSDLLYILLEVSEMAVKEDKFIVFPKKDLAGISATQVATLNEIDQLVQMNRIKRGASQFPKFITCNQDEPYADKVWQIILDGESAKEHSV